MEYPLSIRSYGYSLNKQHFVLRAGCHEAEWVLFALEEGSFRFALDGVEDTLGPGEVLLGPPGMELYREALSPMNIHYMVFFIERDREEPPLLERVRAEKAFKLQVQDKSRLFSSLRLMKPASDHHDRESMRKSAHYLNDIYMTLMHEFSEAQEMILEAPDEQMLLAKSWLEEQRDRPLQLKELARRLGLSQVGLTRRFKACFGRTPKEYLTMLKLEKAKALLADTDYTLEHIASLCGYESGYYLSRVFAKHVKIRPSVYRRIYRL